MWDKTRKEHLLQQSCCQACGTKRRLQVHHIEPYHVNPSRELDSSNLITLCKSCHFVFGHLMDWASWNKDVVNDSAVYLNKVQNRPYRVYSQNNQSLFSILKQYYEKYYG